MKFLPRLLFITILSAVIIFSLKPVTSDSVITDMKFTSSGADLHLVIYLLLTLSGYFSFTNINKKNMIPVVGFVGITSFGLEIIQHFLPCRTFNWMDITGNLAGITLAGFIIYKWSGKKFRWFRRRL